MMARPKNTIANEIIFDVRALWERIKDMDSETLGKYIRKAFNDMQNGCVAEDTDEFIKEQYNRSLAKMIKEQKKQARKYQSRINRDNKNNDQETNTNESTNEERCLDLETDCIDATTIAPADASDAGKSKELAKSTKKAYGQNKNVMLTDEEGAHLRELYGEDLKMAIDILDAYIENGGKKAKQYKDHAAVMRRGNWVWNRVIETKNNEARLEKTSRPANLKDFKSMREEEQKRRAFSSLYNTEAL